MQTSILSQDELDFLLTGAVKDRPEQAGAAASAQARPDPIGQEQRQDAVNQPSSAAVAPQPEAGPVSGGACGFPQEARLRFARMLQEALQQDGEALCLVRPEQDGAPPAEAWMPCAELVCAGTAASCPGGACQNADPQCGLQADVRIDARLAQALLARELGAGSYDLGGRAPTRLEQALLENALRAVLDANVTTLIAAVVLRVRGTGSIQGFARTLLLGVVVSMISAVIITRLLMNCFVKAGADKAGCYAKIVTAEKEVEA